MPDLQGMKKIVSLPFSFYTSLYFFIYILISSHTNLLKCEGPELSRRRLSNWSRHLGSKNENSFYSSQGGASSQNYSWPPGSQGGRVVIRRGRPSNCVNPDQWAISQSEDRSVGSVTNQRSGIWHILKSVETSGPHSPACPCVVWKHRMMPVTQWGWSVAGCVPITPVLVGVNYHQWGFVSDIRHKSRVWLFRNPLWPCIWVQSVIFIEVLILKNILYLGWV